jgi:hypothetical protein
MLVPSGGCFLASTFGSPLLSLLSAPWRAQWDTACGYAFNGLFWYVCVCQCVVCVGMNPPFRSLETLIGGNVIIPLDFGRFMAVCVRHHFHSAS